MAGQADYDRNRIAERTKRRLMIRFGTDLPEKTGYTKDISETGLFIRTNNVLPPGDKIQVQVEFPEESFNLRAKVIWAKQVSPHLAHIMDCGMGVHFIEPPADWLEFCRNWKER